MPLEYCHCIVILLLFIVSCLKKFNCHIFIVLASDILYFIVLSSDCFTMMSYRYCVSIVYACHLKLAFVHLLYRYLLCEHSITPCGLNKVYLILSYLRQTNRYLLKMQKHLQNNKSDLKTVCGKWYILKLM